MKILVTGGASGLGKEITSLLADKKDSVVYITYNKSVEEARAICSNHSNVHSIKCDFSNPDDLKKLTEKINEIELDILINNALGSFKKNHFHKLPPDSFVESFTNNILPVILITQNCILKFRKQKDGRIINILSSAIINTPPIGWSEYVAKKNYLLSLSKSWAVENAAFNITSNCISPSFMQTALNADIDDRLVEQMVQSHPFKKLLTPKEVADSVLFLCTCSKHINGINLVMNAAENID